MLDNLKLGYGGTQSEMIRLINDSGILNEKIEDLDNVTFDQMIQAIHKVQQNLGITGTSAKEASTTIEGSVNSAKAAWENFEAGVISANDLVDTFWTAAKNILNNLGQMIPRLGKTGMDVVESLSGKIGEAVPQLKGLTDSVGKLADKLKNMSTDELMNLGKSAAVLAGAGPVISLFGSQIGNVQSAVEGFSGITTGVLSELGKLPKGFKSATKSATNFQKDFTGSLKGLGSAITGPFQVNPKILINDYPYEFFVTLESREYLIIDSQRRTIRRYLTNGTVQNLFNQRAQKQTVFERIPSGLLNINWSGDYGFDLTLFLNRREPPW